MRAKVPQPSSGLESRLYSLVVFAVLILSVLPIPTKLGA